MTEHQLRIAPQWFDKLASGVKTSEVRKHDRDFVVGDSVVFIDDTYRFNASVPVRAIRGWITHILPASLFPEGLQVGYSVLSLDLGDRRILSEEEIS